MKLAKLGKSSQMWPKGFDTLVRLFFRRSLIDVYCNSVMETPSHPYIGGRDRRGSHDQLASITHYIWMKEETNSYLFFLTNNENKTTFLNRKQR